MLLTQLRRLQQSHPAPFFVKVGAHDGLTADPCGTTFLSNPSWSGLLIEPVPYCLHRAQQNYNDPSRFTFEQVAVGTHSGRATFYYLDDLAHVRPRLPSWHNQIGSLDRSHIVNHLHGRLEPYILDMEVQVERLSAILTRHGIGDFAFLQIDCEGHDLDVLQSLNFANHRPQAIYVEHCHLQPDDRFAMKTLLEEQRYTVRDLGTDFLAALHLD